MCLLNVFQPQANTYVYVFLCANAFSACRHMYMFVSVQTRLSLEMNAFMLYMYLALKWYLYCLLARHEEVVEEEKE